MNEPIVDTVFKAALALPLLLMSLLLAAVLTAGHASAAAGDQACGGDNLLDALAKNDPGRYTEVIAEAKATPFGDATLYRIERDGIEPSYLFGTMHLTDPRVTDLDAATQQALDAAQTVAIETIEVLDPMTAQMALLSKPHLTMFTDEQRLSDWLDDDERALVEAGLSERGMRLALIDRMKPWIVNGMLGLPSCELDRKQGGAEILDIAIARHAEAQGKTLVGLETIVEQMEAIASLPMEDHVNGLVETLRLGDTMDDVIETMINLYLDDKPGLVWPLLRTVSEADKEGTHAAAYAAFQEVMIDQRNRLMLERSLPLLEKGGAFIAVGALHLPGESGLARLAQDAGYTVTPVNH